VRPPASAHFGAFLAAVRRLARHPIASLFEVAVLGIALALPLGLFIVVDSVRSFVGLHPAAPEVSVFLQLDAEEAAIRSTRARLAALAEVESVRFVSRQEALGALRQSPALRDVLDALPGNPLPDAFTVRARELDPDGLEKLRAEIAGWPHVALAQLDSAWARRASAAVQLGHAAAWALAVLLGVAAAAVTFNTVRLQMLDRRSEIELARLIGATDPYIRRPFVYFGALQGFFGGALALALAIAGTRLATQSLDSFSAAYGTRLGIAPVPPEHALGFLGIATLLGAGAAWIAANRYVWAHRLRLGG
jgi:cell division transport system permease protein